MSIDVIDDLHNAEDRIGRLEQSIRKIVDAWETGDLAAAVNDARIAVEDGYCRPSCGAAESDDPDEWNCDDDCGCPCHNRRAWPLGYVPGERPVALGCSCSPDPDTGELRDDDGWACSHDGGG